MRNATAFLVATIALIVVLAQPAGAQIQLPSKICPDRVAVTSFALVPESLAPGSIAGLVLSFKNNCSSGDSIDVPWQITKDGLRVDRGIYPAVAPGQTVYVRSRWLAKVGNHSFSAWLDPDNTLVEGSTYRANNVAAPVAVTVDTDWSLVRNRTTAGFKEAVAAWMNASRLQDVVINGMIATEGHLTSPLLYDALRPAIAGVPDELATPIAHAIADQWKRWSDSVKANAAVWYPGYQCCPGVCSGHANVPLPMLALFQDRSPLSAENLAAAMNAKLGSLSSFSGAPAAITAIANDVAVCFNTYGTQPVVNVIGFAPAPFDALATGCGPAANGRGNQNGPFVPAITCP